MQVVYKLYTNGRCVGVSVWVAHVCARPSYLGFRFGLYSPT